ncbi:hypothetical protein MCGE09_00031 [Thaumarchaeota archaeon SCGC AB-539-E09]|nr:hypothetical protein MCGE09_00031 [Thaumarchaeota archaeon SCGC AB-539-E09]
MTELDVERRTLENLVLFHSEELRRIHREKDSARILTPGVSRKMVESGVLIRHRKRNTAHHTLSPEALNILESSEVGSLRNRGRGRHTLISASEASGGGGEDKARPLHPQEDTA